MKTIESFVKHYIYSFIIVILFYKNTLKCKRNVFFIAEFERAAKIRKIAVYRFLISPLVPGLKRYKDE